jgi:tRNA nucleotidyltransferase/poly(A) polymerase
MIFNKTCQIISIIERHGYVALIVGGAVRDFIMRSPVLDIDLATDMDFAKLSQIFPCRGIGKSRNFGIMSIEYQGEHFDITSLIRDNESRNHDAALDKKKTSLFYSDARRRDFTINAMAMDAQGQILDPLGGRIDIQKKIIRAADNPDRTFTDDPLRMLRAVRFASVFGFEIEPQTFACIRRLCPEINKSAAERITAELISLASLTGKDFVKGLILMQQSGLLEQILPEIHRLRDFSHYPDHHPEGGVFQHTMAALRANEEADPGINLSILFHDAGKAETFALKDSCPTYHGHEKAGEKIILKVAKRLRFPHKLVKAISFVALNHMKALKINEMKPAKIYRLMTDPHWPVLKSVVRCDLLARSEQKAGMFDREIEALNQKLSQWLDKEQSVSRPVITGTQVMEYTGLPRGPEIGMILKLTTSWAINNNIIDRDEIREYVRNCRSAIKQPEQINLETSQNSFKGKHQ